MAYHTYEQSLCSCGCGYPADLAHDPAVRERVQMRIEDCYVREAIHAFHEDHKGDLQPHQLVSVQVLPPGQRAVDPMEWSQEKAAVSRAERNARLGLPADYDE